MQHQLFHAACRKQGPQAGLQAAHDLGTQAAIDGLAMPDLVQLHVQALAALVLPDCSAGKREIMTKSRGHIFHRGHHAHRDDAAHGAEP